nr:hypothetical protein Iba_chr02fCG1820 [Ipomoea batatas]
MVVAEGASAANLRIVSNASSLIADYMEVDGGEESSTDWGIGRMLLPSNDPTTGHIVYPVANHRRELCDANRYQSCLPPGSPSKPIDCKDFRDRTC